MSETDHWYIVRTRKNSKRYCGFDAGGNPVRWLAKMKGATSFSSEEEALEIARALRASHYTRRTQALSNDIVLPDYTFDVILA
jgi:hypothetical protein